MYFEDDKRTLTVFILFYLFIFFFFRAEIWIN